MATTTFKHSADERYFEDYPVGAAFECGSVRVTQEEIIEFAERYDPQAFHVDPADAKRSIYGGIIASGWHTGALLMRLLVDNFLSSVAGMGSPGVDDMRWPRPVRPGDVLRLRVTVLEARVSKSKPDRGVMKTLSEMLNQDDEVVMAMTATNFVGRRAALDKKVKSGSNGGPE